MALTAPHWLDFSERLVAFLPWDLNTIRTYLDQFLDVQHEHELCQKFDALPKILDEILTILIPASPHIVQALNTDFNGTVCKLYRLVRCIHLNRNPSVFRRDTGCVITGLSAPRIRSQRAHIMPFAVANKGLPNDFYDGLVCLFNESIADHVWSLCGGLNCNNIDNVCLLSPTMHWMFDNGKIFLVPEVSRVDGVLFSDVWNIAQMSIDNSIHYVRYQVEYEKTLLAPSDNEYTSRRIAGHSGTCHSLQNLAYLQDGPSPGHPLLHAIYCILSEASSCVDMTRGNEAVDLGWVLREN